MAQIYAAASPSSFWRPFALGALVAAAIAVVVALALAWAGAGAGADEARNAGPHGLVVERITARADGRFVDMRFVDGQVLSVPMGDIAAVMVIGSRTNPDDLAQAHGVVLTIPSPAIAELSEQWRARTTHAVYIPAMHLTPEQTLAAVGWNDDDSLDLAVPYRPTPGVAERLARAERGAGASDPTFAAVLHDVAQSATRQLDTDDAEPTVPAASVDDDADTAPSSRPVPVPASLVGESLDDLTVVEDPPAGSPDAQAQAVTLEGDEPTRVR